eukprot:14406131-Alexandrium_andersonii.AAC.1
MVPPGVRRLAPPLLLVSGHRPRAMLGCSPRGVSCGACGASGMQGGPAAPGLGEPSTRAWHTARVGQQPLRGELRC